MCLLAKSLIRRAKKETPVIAKLEKPEAIENLEGILRVSDGVMVARGDLGVEMSPERVPVVQKNIIARAREFRRPVITATQMLESMTENPRPTRAEASDVANAIFDGESDAVMLSAETASGKYPVEAVSMMARIIEEAEASIPEFKRPASQEKLQVAETVAELVWPRFARIAHEVDCGFYAQRIHRAADFALPAAAADCGVFSRSGDAAAAGTGVGSCAAGNSGSPKGGPVGGNFRKTIAGRKTGTQRRCDRDCGRDSDGRTRYHEFHEVPCDWRRGE